MKNIEVINYENGVYVPLVLSLNGIKDTLLATEHLTSAGIDSGMYDAIVFNTAKSIAQRQYNCNNIIQICYLNQQYREPVKGVVDSYTINPNIIQYGLSKL